MSVKFKTTTNNIEALDIIKNFKTHKENEIIDLSNLNLFDATRTIIMLSTYYFQKNPTQKIRCKVSTPNIENILKDIPLNNIIELV